METQQQRMKRSRAAGNKRARDSANGSSAIRPTEAARTQARYRQRRVKDVKWAHAMGVSQEFLDTEGAQYIAGNHE